MERHPKILETLSIKSPLLGQIPTLKGSQFATHHYINTRPPLFLDTQKIPNSLTMEFLEISHSLTWLSEGSWPVPHWCLLFSHCVFIPQVLIGMTWSLQLTDDFSTSSISISSTPSSLTWISMIKNSTTFKCISNSNIQFQKKKKKNFWAEHIKGTVLSTT